MPGLKIVWHPNVDGHPGSHFFVQFRRKGETIYEKSPDEYDESFIILRGLDPNQLYELRVVAVDGDYVTESDAEEVVMYDGKSRRFRPHDTVRTCGVHWIDVNEMFLPSR